MYSTTSFRLTKEQYNYLLPTELKSKLLYRPNGIKLLKCNTLIDEYSFIGTKEEFQDVLNRCKFLDNDLLNESLDYKNRFDYNVKYNSGVCFKYIHH